MQYNASQKYQNFTYFSGYNQFGYQYGYEQQVYSNFTGNGYQQFQQKINSNTDYEPHNNSHFQQVDYTQAKSQNRQSNGMNPQSDYLRNSGIQFEQSNRTQTNQWYDYQIEQLNNSQPNHQNYAQFQQPNNARTDYAREYIPNNSQINPQTYTPNITAQTKQSLRSEQYKNRNKQMNVTQYEHPNTAQLSQQNYSQITYMTNTIAQAEQIDNAHYEPTNAHRFSQQNYAQSNQLNSTQTYYARNIITQTEHINCAQYDKQSYTQLQQYQQPNNGQSNYISNVKQSNALYQLPNNANAYYAAQTQYTPNATAQNITPTLTYTGKCIRITSAATFAEFTEKRKQLQLDFVQQLSDATMNAVSDITNAFDTINTEDNENQIQQIDANENENKNFESIVDTRNAERVTNYLLNNKKSNIKKEMEQCQVPILLCFLMTACDANEQMKEEIVKFVAYAIEIVEEKKKKDKINEADTVISETKRQYKGIM
ncbi:hypothetical protein GPJ56_008017 [Histomonas meleagridis]|uniref:uncharacterized protein n=1 Tax=Histomonas meleagridis TaxID=135588 RepID=UPI00355A5D15|nr:hypothetical protein GPJ56_008017 [Histomonas meleagridis]KAH0803960.1 hypothetical protein GO595_002790 [Histomonas meleagridis]